MGRYSSAVLKPQDPPPVSPFPLRAAFTWTRAGAGGPKAYAILPGGWYQCSDWDSSLPDDGYPSQMSDWAGLPDGWTDFDAAICVGDEPERCLTLFRGAQTCVYHMDDDQVVGAVQAIRDAFPGLSSPFHDGIDAAAEGRPGRNHDFSRYYYLFRGDRYHRLVRRSRSVDPLMPGPESVLEHWRLQGRLKPPFDAVLNGGGPRGDALYFIAGHRYVRYTWSTDSVSEVRLIGDQFPELVPTVFQHFRPRQDEQLAQTLVRFVQEAEGLSPVHDPHILGALVARGVDDPSRMIFTGTNCATTALGFLVAACGSVARARSLCAVLGQPYQAAAAIRWLFGETGSVANPGAKPAPRASLEATGVVVRVPQVGGLKTLEKERWPQPGDLLFYRSGNNEHVEWLLSEIEETGGALMARHGGGGRDFEPLDHENIPTGTPYHDWLEAMRKKRRAYVQQHAGRSPMPYDPNVFNPFYCAITVGHGDIEHNAGRPLVAWISTARLQERLRAR